MICLENLYDDMQVITLLFDFSKAVELEYVDKLCQTFDQMDIGLAG
jgi:hypothetical protein